MLVQISRSSQLLEWYFRKHFLEVEHIFLTSRYHNTCESFYCSFLQDATDFWLAAITNICCNQQGGFCANFFCFMVCEGSFGEDSISLDKKGSSEALLTVLWKELSTLIWLFWLNVVYGSLERFCSFSGSDCGFIGDCCFCWFSIVDLAEVRSQVVSTGWVFTFYSMDDVVVCIGGKICFFCRKAWTA